MPIAEDSTMTRSLAVAVAVLMAMISTGACYLAPFGPDPVQYAALAVIDGRPTAVVAACGRSTVDVKVYLGGNTMDDDFHVWSVTVTLPDQTQDVEVELLGAERPGWKITSSQEEVVGASPYSFKVVPLTSIEPGHHYTLDSSDGGPEGSSAPAVSFTTEDLTKIGPGQVLSAVDYDRSKVVSRDSFVNDRCG
ncbi:hypothetical protein [Dactylosporangium sp. CA-139066]|uniref:hypothetical protein n=1 Tax=Dactylosporangium sp. CA-139066 TaxID=3239930 RepID=UPI003D9093E1